jgi:flagellar biosynthesis component FlhA
LRGGEYNKFPLQRRYPGACSWVSSLWGFVSIIAICAAVTFAAKKRATRVVELAVRFLLDIMPEAIMAMEHVYTRGKISEEACVLRKGGIAKQAGF